MQSSPTNSQAPGRSRPGRRRSGTGLAEATRVLAGAAGPAAAPAPIAAPAASAQVVAISQTTTGTALTAGSLGPSLQAVLLDDVQDPAGNGSTTVQPDLGADFSSGTRINPTAGSLTATGGITLGGQTVQSDGTLPTPTPTPVSVSGDTVTVAAAAGSAALSTLTP